MTQYLLSIDQGTTSSRAMLFDKNGRRQCLPHNVNSPSTFPRDGWVEHDPEEIWDTTLGDSSGSNTAGASPKSHAQSPQSESPTSVKPPWSGIVRTGAETVYNAIVWQDRRTARLLRSACGSRVTKSEVSAKTGLLLDPVFFRHQGQLDTGQCRRRARACRKRRTRLRHDRLLPDLAPDRR